MLFPDVMQKEKSISTGTENLTQVFDHKPSFTHNLSELTEKQEVINVPVTSSYARAR